MGFLLCLLLTVPVMAVESFDDTWSRLGKNCMANAFLKRNAANTGWLCSDNPGEVLVIGNTQLSETGFTSTGTVTFSSGVVITGHLEVRSAKTKALSVPYGGIYIDEETPGSSAAVGRIVSKGVVTSTLTLKGSAILFENIQTGVVQATMTATLLEISGVNAGKLQNRNTGAGAPSSADCDEVSEFGMQYFSRTPSRLWICADNGSGGYEWRYTTISP